MLDDGPVRLRMGSSSRDFADEVEIEARSSVHRWRPLRRDTETAFVLQNPHARSVVGTFLAEKVGVGQAVADELLEQCAKSSVNVFTTLANRFRLVLNEGKITALIEEATRREGQAITSSREG
ncbi:hypothetical protein [Phytoactinopolyspora endophytica]|uniref:hypothetical protein n=1 Tax=Phytoactinopolyspora endophytica TaxID=1642495 RepID=UPI00101DED76|nr:hypothetical protein [Phytoactinopolyspora endophytica]